MINFYNKIILCGIMIMMGFGVFQAFSFTMPEIPNTLTHPSDRADFLWEHFWDNVSLEEAELDSSSEDFEQFFVDFLSVLPHVSSDSVRQAGFSTLLNKFGPSNQLFTLVTHLSDVYLFNSDSPMKSDNHYINYLEALINNQYVTEINKIRAEDKIQMLTKNRVGEKAADFKFITVDSKEHTLYSTLPNKGELILIFFDPDCDRCETILSQLIRDRNVASAVEAGDLSVLAVYSGENYELWLKKASLLPEAWKIGYNSGEIEEEEIYYLPQMPTIYILDNKGIVLKKDL